MPPTSVNPLKPVTLPPGRPRLATSPAPTGSPTVVNTIGIVMVAAFAQHVRLPRTNSMANSGSRSECPSADRYSNVMFLHSV